MSRTLIAIASAILCAFGMQARMIKETHVFDIVDTDTLRLDRYTDPAAIRGSEAKPLVLFAFGGSFKTGERDNPDYLPFFEFLTSNGIDVVSTDYRKGLADIASLGINSPQAFAGALGMAVTDAVTDYLHAAAFVAGHARAWGVNPMRIVACGTSSGAITALQSEYTMTAMEPRPPFAFSGVISFAGAVCTPAEPEWTTQPCPMLLFHGDADSTVPYDRVTIQGMGLYGSKSIAESLTKAHVPHIFYTVCGRGHEVAKTPMDNHRYTILGFIRRYVCGNDTSTVEARQTFPDTPASYRTDFTLDDYLRSNL